ncbi:ATP-dependent RNA helicase ATP-dependent RNA helicase [Cryptosporidium bovis]|uniref:ATP-dependent RNA helicase ATP-dependent RNA helicase n=1 Tax=Cryptosporidium bovis TaxID=310047 RepID=UPI00351A2994|nr:ATP-dependent RNA helicase ATP-dependent RNA helicase [Cryptosporidium bovis]
MDALIGELSKVIKKARVEESKKEVDPENFQNNPHIRQEKIQKHDGSMRVEHIIYESGTNCVHECVRPCGYVAPTDSKFRIQFDENGRKIPAREYSFKLDNFQSVSIDCLEIGESVLISAHTSAGKTCVAEYAIAMALKSNQRVVYTSPIKALSNQKYRDLRTSFGDGNVGLLTGDVTVNPLGSIMVMTTEILRSMLYRGSELVREIAWVIFDEIHYMRDKERGVVWEESIILLPDTVRLVFLSATIPNHLEFAEWICRTKHQPCHVVYTDYRPVPLQHFVFPAGGNGIYLVVDENKVFRQDNYSKALSTLKLSTENMTSQKETKKNSSRNQQRIDLESIIEMCQERSYLPIIVFSFSKKDCELNALSLKNVDLSTEEEKESIEFIFNSALATLAEEDRKIPQVVGMLPLLRRGIGIHHGGLLPVVKEIVELLFGESFIKVLFSTETFSMGINMPAKTVIFTSLRKFDGNEYRIINSGEFIQMSGRAGRRGLDDRGITITMIDELADPWAIKSMLTGQPLRIDSQFYIGYNMLLNLLRLEGADPEYMINRSFSQFLKRKKTVSLTEEKERIKEIIEKYSIKNPQLKIGDLNENKIKKKKGSSNSINNDQPAAVGNFTVVSRKIEGIDDIYDSLQERLIRPEFPTLKDLLFSYSYFLYLAGFNVTCNDLNSINLNDFYKKYNLASNLHAIAIPGIHEIILEQKSIKKAINEFTKLLSNKFSVNPDKENHEVDIILKSIGDEKELEENLALIGNSLYANLCELIELNNSIKKFVINSKIIHGFYSPGRLVFVKFPYIKREDIINFERDEICNYLDEAKMNKDNSFFNYLFYPNSFFGFEEKQILNFGWGVVLSNPIYRSNKTSTGFVLQPLKSDGQDVNADCETINDLENYDETNPYYLKVLLDKRALPKFVYNAILKELESIGDSINDNSNYFILNCSISTIYDISTIRLNIPEFNSAPTNSNTTILKSLEISLIKVADHLRNERIPLLDYYGDDIINVDTETKCSNVRSKIYKYRSIKKQIENSVLVNNAPSLTLILLFICSHKRHLERRAMSISGELHSNKYDSIMQRELDGMRRVLKRLDYIDEDGIVQLKGRIACEISSSDELLIAELLFNNVFFQELKIEYIVAILSSLLYDEKYQEPKLEDPILSTGYENIIEVAKMIVNVSTESGLDIDIEQYLSKFRPQIMAVILKWSKGESFESTLENTSLYEGSVIRCLRRLEELLRQVASATKSIGNEDLESKLKEGISLIRRGIVFTPSLYL